MNQFTRVDELYQYACPKLAANVSTGVSVLDTMPYFTDVSRHIVDFISTIPFDTYIPYASQINDAVIEPLSHQGFCGFVQGYADQAAHVARRIAQSNLSVERLRTITVSDLFALLAVYSFIFFIIWMMGKATFTFLSLFYGSKRSKTKKDLFLLDFALWNNFEDFIGYTADEWYERTQRDMGCTKEGAAFTLRVAQNSGLDPNIRHVFPPGITSTPTQINMTTARQESELMMFPVVEELLTRNKLNSTDIDVLVVNCSLFNPTPSHCSMIINHFGMNPNIICYSLSGMGCSASPIAINCARDALLTHHKKNPIAIVVSFENLTQNLYQGTEKGMLVSNALFRSGCSAMLLGTSSYVKGIKAQYKLDQLVRIHLGARKEAYGSIFQEPDQNGFIGVRLSKDVPKIAGIALTRNMTILGQRILPLRTKVLYGIQLVISKILRTKAPTPNFLTAIDHVAIHAGGRGVIDAIESSLSLPPHITAPSRYILSQYGNQSSASIWYTFKHIHNTCNVKKGEKIWQIAFGSGFKCNSLVWQRL